MLELLERARDGALSDDEAAELENYRHVGTTLELMQSSRPALPEVPASELTMPRPSRAQVESTSLRAGGRCEYCRFPMAVSRLPFHCDHIIAEKHGGPAAGENLA